MTPEEQAALINQTLEQLSDGLNWNKYNIDQARQVLEQFAATLLASTTTPTCPFTGCGRIATHGEYCEAHAEP